MTEATLQAQGQPTGTYTPGAFVWHEFRSRDVEAAKKFYCGLFGWTVKGHDMGHMTYHLIHAGDKQIGGFYQFEPGNEAPTHWEGMVSVPNVDAAAEAVKKAGGQILVGPFDIPNVGRYACALDPQRANVGLFHGLKGDPATNMPEIGEFCWDVLVTNDLEGAGTFYNQVIGWNKVDMGGDHLFKMGDLMEASLMKAPEGTPSHWMPVVAVANLDAAQKKAVELGAKVLIEKQDNDYGSFSVIADPLGGIIGIFVAKES